MSVPVSTRLYLNVPTDDGGSGQSRRPQPWHPCCARQLVGAGRRMPLSLTLRAAFAAAALVAMTGGQHHPGAVSAESRLTQIIKLCPDAYAACGGNWEHKQCPAQLDLQRRFSEIACGYSQRPGLQRRDDRLADPERRELGTGHPQVSEGHELLPCGDAKAEDRLPGHVPPEGRRQAEAGNYAHFSSKHHFRVRFAQIACVSRRTAPG